MNPENPPVDLALAEELASEGLPWNMCLWTPGEEPLRWSSEDTFFALALEQVSAQRDRGWAYSGMTVRIWEKDKHFQIRPPAKPLPWPFNLVARVVPEIYGGSVLRWSAFDGNGTFLMRLTALGGADLESRLERT